jgi:hypothetical protein
MAGLSNNIARTKARMKSQWAASPNNAAGRRLVTLKTVLLALTAAVALLGAAVIAVPSTGDHGIVPSAMTYRTR